MKVTFVVPVFNTHHKLLQICVNSILHTVADQHELILIDDASTNPKTLEFLDKCRKNDTYNINVLTNNENCGVSYSLNKGISSAKGDYISPVDHDDLIIPSGFKVAEKHIKYFCSPWVYTNEIQVDTKGYLIRSLHKPVYSKQLLRSLMYLNHLQVFSKDLFETIGGYREGLEGSQDHDLALRMTKLYDPLHVPSFGYQWRIMKETQSRHDWKVSEDSVNSSIQALSDYFMSTGQLANITVAQQGYPVYKSRVVQNDSASVSIIIPAKLGTTREINGEQVVLLENCLEAIKNTIYEPNGSEVTNRKVECILVINENDNTNDGQKLLKQYHLPGKIIKDVSPFNFSRKCNLGATHASGNILVFLNDDTEILTNDWLIDVKSLLSEEDVACLGGMLLNQDGTVQSCGDNVGLNSATHYVPYPDPMNEGDPMHRYWADHETTSVTGAFFCCRKTLFFDFEGFREVFNNSFQDVDFCLRVRTQGFRCLISPHIKLIHYESSSRNPEVDIETLGALLSFHHRLISGSDEYQLWAYQPVKASWTSLAGGIHKLLQVRNMVYTILRNIRKLLPSPRKRFGNLIN